VTRRWLGAAKLAHDAAVDGAVTEAEYKAKQWLATDQPEGAFDRHPLHWPLVFPEVFDPARPGFDAIIGNPPFLGGTKITGPLGVAYREYLIENIADSVRAGGRCDLIAYFLLRANFLLNERGQTGLIATNTLAQGDTREVGLDQIVAGGTEIRQAVKSKPWPSRSAVLEYAAVWTSRAPLSENAERRADSVQVGLITSTLDPGSRVTGKAERLAANRGLYFAGSEVRGMGFIMDEAAASEIIAQDPNSVDVLFPFLNGEDVNSRPDCSARRLVINFRDWEEAEAARYHACYDRVVRLVRQERMAKSEAIAGKHWWRFARYRGELYKAIEKLDRIIVITRVSKSVMPVLVPNGQIFSDRLCVFATSNPGMLTLLSSAPHYWWAISRSSTMKADLNYSPTDVFETLPIPDLTPEMQTLGGRLDTFRRNLMLSRQAGLTATYNLVHDPKCADGDINELRDIHRAIDEAVVRAYGWTDLLDSGLNHGFHDTRQGTRYTIGPVVRQEILDRLLELNHARYAAEVKAGLHDKRRKKRSVADSGDMALF
jgi:hypothetical protein